MKKTFLEETLWMRSNGRALVEETLLTISHENDLLNIDYLEEILV